MEQCTSHGCWLSVAPALIVCEFCVAVMPTPGAMWPCSSPASYPLETSGPLFKFWRESLIFISRSTVTETDSHRVQTLFYPFWAPGWRQGLRSLATKERRTTLAAPTSWGNVGRNSLDISQTKTPKKLKQNRINKIQTPFPQVFIFYDFSPLLCNLMSLYTKCRSHSTALRGKSGFECQPCVPWASISLSVKWVNIT